MNEEELSNLCLDCFREGGCNFLYRPEGEHE